MCEFGGDRKSNIELDSLRTGDGTGVGEFESSGHGEITFGVSGFGKREI